MKHPTTPDGRYFVVRGRLWRTANPELVAAVQHDLVDRLMASRSAVRRARQAQDEADARAAVDLAKTAVEIEA